MPYNHKKAIHKMPPPNPEHTCSRCTATTNSGSRCKLRTCRSQLCWLHLWRDKGLRIRPSGQGPNAGMGLWAEREIPRNRVIAPYAGISYTREQLDHDYGGEQADYTFCAYPNKCKDARRTNSTAARYANTTTPQAQARRNAKLTSRFNLTSKRRIPAGQEILTSYGPQYTL